MVVVAVVDVFLINGLMSNLVFLSLCRFRQRLLENLRMLPHAPGVQMQVIAEDAVPDHNVDEDTEDRDERLSSNPSDLLLNQL